MLVTQLPCTRRIEHINIRTAHPHIVQNEASNSIGGVWGPRGQDKITMQRDERLVDTQDWSLNVPHKFIDASGGSDKDECTRT